MNMSFSTPPSPRLQPLTAFGGDLEGFLQHVEHYRQYTELKEQMEKTRKLLLIQDPPQTTLIGDTVYLPSPLLETVPMPSKPNIPFPSAPTPSGSKSAESFPNIDKISEELSGTSYPDTKAFLESTLPVRDPNSSKQFIDLDAQIKALMTKGTTLWKEGRWDRWKIYACIVCGKEDKYSNIKRHIEAKHIEGISIPCSFCERIFKSRRLLKEHNTIQHHYQYTELKPQVELAEKNNWIDVKSEGIKHLMKDEEPELTLVNPEEHNYKDVPVYAANDKLDHKIFLETHFSRPFDNIDSLDCSLCSKTMKNRSNLNSHYMAVHDRKQSNCKFCGKTYKNRKRLRDHMRVAHDNTAVNKCSKCEKMFTTKFNWLRHNSERCLERKKILDELKHAKEKVQVEKLEYKMSREIKQQDNGPCVCNICHTRFNRRYEFMRHVKKKHPGEIDTTQNIDQFVRCHLCEFKSVTYKILMKHKTDDHIGRKIYLCKYCTKCYSTSASLKGHKRVNHGTETENKYECTKEKEKGCGKTFKLKRSLERHIKNSCGKTLKPWDQLSRWQKVKRTRAELHDKKDQEYE